MNKMINYIDIYKLKDKFAKLLCRLYFNANIGLEGITNKIIYSKYFNCFEENNIEEFIVLNYEDIAKKLFNSDLRFVGEDNYNAALYWSGIQYINISLNLNIPLRQVFLLCPLNEMLTYFEVYHEMNNNVLIERYKKTISKKSILKRIRKDKGLTVKQLSFLSSISEMTIKYYEKENTNLFKASFENILSLTKALDIDYYLLIEKSNFIPISINLFNNTELRKNIFEDIFNYLQVKNKKALCFLENNEKNDKYNEDNLYFIKDILSSDEKKQLAKIYRNIVFIDDEISYYQKKSNIEIRILTQNESNNIIKKAINKTLSTTSEDNLLF